MARALDISYFQSFPSIGFSNSNFCKYGQLRISTFQSCTYKSTSNVFMLCFLFNDSRVCRIMFTFSCKQNTHLQYTQIQSLKSQHLHLCYTQNYKIKTFTFSFEVSHPHCVCSIPIVQCIKQSERNYTVVVQLCSDYLIHCTIYFQFIETYYLIHLFN